MAWEASWTNEAGIAHRLERTSDGHLLDHASQDVAPILDLNKAMAVDGDGYLSKAREVRRVASIPMSLIMLWKTVEGWDALNPNHAEKLRQKLNSNEFQYLRTAPGRL